MSTAQSFQFGVWSESADLTEQSIGSLLKTAKSRQEQLQDLPITKICDAIGALQPMWSKGGSSREEFLKKNPDGFGRLSGPMTVLGLDALSSHLVADVALTRIRSQLGSEQCLNFMTGGQTEHRRAVPLGVVLHVISGSPFFGIAESLLAALATKNVSILKTSAITWGFLSLFVASLETVSPEIASCVAVLPWQGGDETIEHSLASGVDGIIVAGSSSTLATYRTLASPATALIELGPRVSVAVLSEGASVDTRDLALDVAMWDQLACTAAQCIYVEGSEKAKAVAADVALALEALEKTIPVGRTDIDERIEVAQMRGVAKFASCLGETEITSAEPPSTTTVIFDATPDFVSSPLRRCVRVKSYHNLDELVETLVPIGSSIQTVGLAVLEEQREEYQKRLRELGARRVCSIGEMNFPGPTELRDGMQECLQLTRWMEMSDTP